MNHERGSTIRLCEGLGKNGEVCPLFETCAFWCHGFDKSKTDHWGFAPYNFHKGECRIYEPIDVDTKILTNAPQED